MGKQTVKVQEVRIRREDTPSGGGEDTLFLCGDCLPSIGDFATVLGKKPRLKPTDINSEAS